MIQSIHQGLLAEGIKVPLTRLCAWFGVPRRTVYYRPTKAAPKVDPRFAEPIKTMIEQEPSFGYRTVALTMEIRSLPSPKVMLLTCCADVNVTLGVLAIAVIVTLLASVPPVAFTVTVSPSVVPTMFAILSLDDHQIIAADGRISGQATDHNAVYRRL